MADGSTGYKRYISRGYLASLPERTARAGAALTGGLVYETGEVLLPLAVLRSRFYQAVVGRLLRITIELVGGVEGVFPTEGMQARELLVRKSAGNVVEIGSFLAVGWAPVWLLAGASDLIGGFEGGPRGVGAPVERRRRTRLVARTTAAGVGPARRQGPGGDLLRAAVGRATGGPLGHGDLFHRGARRSARWHEAGKRPHLRLLSRRAADHRGRGPGLVLVSNEHPLPDAGAFALRSRVEHRLGTPPTTLGRPPFIRGKPNDARRGVERREPPTDEGGGMKISVVGRGNVSGWLSGS